MKNSADKGECYPQRLRLRWITPSEICRILHILRKPNSIIALFFIQKISPFLKEFFHFALCFSAHQNNTTLSPGFLGQQFNILLQAALLTSFWRHRFNNFQLAALLTSLVQYLVNSSWLWWIIRAVLTNQKRRNILHFWCHWSIFGQWQLVVVNYACGFNQSKTEKYFEWIINVIIILAPALDTNINLWTSIIKYSTLNPKCKTVPGSQ